MLAQLLAPAGTYESLQAAISSGCNAVYFGVSQLNMRARSSSNFDIGDLKKIAAICKQNKVHSYLALNSLLYQHDIKLMNKILEAAKAAQVSAIIAADIATIMAARQLDIPIHISTQLSVSNVETVQFWSEYADTIVLARELTLPMIAKITNEIHKQNITGPSGKLVNIEIFAHGALCIAISGRCGMSLYTANASANRGACTQNCRKPYVVTDKETGMQLEIDNEYVMSPKDICTIDFLDKVVEAGVSLLKIEGRGRAPEYVAEVLSCYKEALQAIEQKEYNTEKVAAWLVRLKSVYNRGLSDGYYLGKKQGEFSVIPNSQASKEKVYIGQVRHYYPKAHVMQVEVIAHPLKKGDDLIITGVTTGILKDTVTNLLDEKDKEINIANKNNLVTLPVKDKVRISDKVYIEIDRK